MKKIHCYAQKEANGWVALCLDFDLAAQGETLTEARATLDAMIADYIEDAATIDSEFADSLLTRRAPLRYWLSFYWLTLIRSSQAFGAPMPLVMTH